MSIYQIDPLTDSRWPELLDRHPRASVFHSRNWLKALKSSYGYEPVVFTTAPPQSQLSNGWVFCRVESWLTGRRLVSLPFSDHCDPLVGRADELDEIADYLIRERTNSKLRYVECRLAAERAVPENFGNCEQFCFHLLNLQPELNRLFERFHKSSTQRKIKRAEREALTYRAGNSEELLDQFYRLLVLTRRRHRVPPQPKNWYANLLACFGNQLKVRVAFHKEIPVATILTLQFKDTLIYKYGGADEHYFALGGMQMLFWKAIQDAKKKELSRLDLGRSDIDAEGLMVMKDRLGAERSAINYFRNPPPEPADTTNKARTLRRSPLRKVFANRVGAFGGRLLYRHFG
jgi:hypothetical protein